MSKLRTYPTSRLRELQRRINGVFVKLRDGGKNIDFIYRHLSGVERELSLRRAYW